MHRVLIKLKMSDKSKFSIVKGKGGSALNNKSSSPVLKPSSLRPKKNDDDTRRDLSQRDMKDTASINANLTV